MARRSDYSRDELKEMSIAVGQEIVSAESFSGFSARKVAKKIGYTVGTIYNIFESHEDLILHINAATLEDMNKFIIDNISAKPNIAEAIKELSNLYIKFANTNYNRWSALFEFNLPQGSSLPEWYKKIIEKLFSVVEKPLINTQDAHRHAKVLWAGIHGICQLSLTGKLDAVGSESIQVLTDSLIDNYIRGLEL